MAQWQGKRAIMKKYQISLKELLHIINKGKITYSDVDGVLMIDEVSFVAYIVSLRQVEKQNNAVYQLQRVLRSGKKLELDETEAALARRLEGRVVSIYTRVSRALGRLLECQEREIFLAFLKGESIVSVARQMGMQPEAVFRIFEESLKKLDSQTDSIIGSLVVRSQKAEEENQCLLQRLAEKDKCLAQADYEMQKKEVQLASLRRENNFCKSSYEYLQVRFDTERKINSVLEEMLDTYNRYIGTDYFSSVVSYLSRLFHRTKS